MHPVYTCPKSKLLQCNTFIWVDEEDNAKEWLLQNGPCSPPPPEPETPVSKKKGKGVDPETRPTKDQETPFTKAKRKPISREASDDKPADGGESSKGAGDSVLSEREGDSWIDSAVGDGSPSRKVAKRTRFSTPTQKSHSKNPQEAIVTLPTPVTEPYTATNPRQAEVPPSPSAAARDKGKGISRDIFQLQESINLPDFENRDLSDAILRLLRSEGVEVKESLELQIRHEIDLESDANEAREKRYQVTIKQLVGRVDELENMVSLLT